MNNNTTTLKKWKKNSISSLIMTKLIDIYAYLYICISKYLILFALFGLGSSISINNLKGFGFKPFLVGFCISVVLIVSTTIYLKLI